MDGTPPPEQQPVVSKAVPDVSMGAEKASVAPHKVNGLVVTVLVLAIIVVILGAVVVGLVITLPARGVPQGASDQSSSESVSSDEGQADATDDQGQPVAASDTGASVDGSGSALPWWDDPAYGGAAPVSLDGSDQEQPADESASSDEVQPFDDSGSSDEVQPTDDTGTGNYIDANGQVKPWWDDPAYGGTPTSGTGAEADSAQ